MKEREEKYAQHRHRKTDHRKTPKELERRAERIKQKRETLERLMGLEPDGKASE